MVGDANMTVEDAAQEATGYRDARWISLAHVVYAWTDRREAGADKSWWRNAGAACCWRCAVPQPVTVDPPAMEAPAALDLGVPTSAQPLSEHACAA
jgi:hypothetical protein